MGSFFLNDDDRAQLIAMARQLMRDQGQDNTGQRPRVGFEQDDHPAPEVYVAKPPTAGIPALVGPGGIGTGTVGDEPGVAMCPVYRLQPKPGSAGVVELEPLNRANVQVWNLSTSIIHSWCLVIRDKLGQWWAIPSAVGGGGGTSDDFWAQITGPANTVVAVSAPSGANYAVGTWWFLVTAIVSGVEVVVAAIASASVTNATNTIKVTLPANPAGNPWGNYAIYSGNPCTALALQTSGGPAAWGGPAISLPSFNMAGVCPPPMSYDWKEAEIYQSFDQGNNGGGNSVYCGLQLAFRDKAGGRSGKSYSSPAYEVGSSYMVLYGSSTFNLVWVRLRPAFNGTLGQEYAFEGGYTGSANRLTGFSYNTSTCVMSSVLQVDQYFNGRLSSTCPTV